MGTTDKRGTMVTFRADPLIYGALKIDYETLSSRFRELSYLTEGVTITLTDLRPLSTGLTTSRARRARCRWKARARSKAASSWSM